MWPTTLFSMHIEPGKYLFWVLFKPKSNETKIYTQSSVILYGKFKQTQNLCAIPLTHSAFSYSERELSVSFLFGAGKHVNGIGHGESTTKFCFIYCPNFLNTSNLLRMTDCSGLNFFFIKKKMKNNYFKRRRRKADCSVAFVWMIPQQDFIFILKC